MPIEAQKQNPILIDKKQTWTEKHVSKKLNLTGQNNQIDSERLQDDDRSRLIRFTV